MVQQSTETANQRAPVLELDHLQIQFGGLKAVSDLSLSIEKSKIFSLIGPNGAGKTTVFNLITGIYKPTSGQIKLNGQGLNGLKPHQITRKGIARTFQNIRLFKNLTVYENLRIAMDVDDRLPRSGLLAELFHLSSMKQVESHARDHGHRILDFVQLSHRSSSSAQYLSYGEQRRLEIARALATGAKILLLDEPAAGMNASETMRLMDTIRNIRDAFDLTIFLIEHDMQFVMGLSEKICVLDFGVKIAEGTPKEIQQNPDVIAAYLGKPAA